MSKQQSYGYTDCDKLYYGGEWDCYIIRTLSICTGYDSLHLKFAEVHCSESYIAILHLPLCYVYGTNTQTMLGQSALATYVHDGR